MIEDEEDEVRQNAQEEAQNYKERCLEVFFLNALNDEGGKMFISHILNCTGVLGGSTFQPDARMQAYIEGKRNIGALVMDMLTRHVPKEFFRELSNLFQEQKNLRRRPK